MPAKREAPTLRVGEILLAAAAEWRTGATMAERVCEGWQLVYVLDGTVEESTDGKPQLLRTGRFLFHQPLERAAMRAVGEVPPEVLRLEFEADGTLLEQFRRRSAPAAAAERNCLRLLAGAVREGWTLPAEPAAGDLPARRGDPPLGVGRLQVLYLEEFLWLLARRLGRARRPGPRARAEQKQVALVEVARLYFAENLDREPTLDEICRAVGCSKPLLQQAFRARTGRTVRDYFIRFKIEQAGALLAQGYPPGEVARMLGYASQSYFSQRFRALTGQTPTAYRRAPKPLHLCGG